MPALQHSRWLSRRKSSSLNKASLSSLDDGPVNTGGDQTQRVRRAGPNLDPLASDVRVRPAHSDSRTPTLMAGPRSQVRPGPLPPYHTDFWDPFHHWMVSTLGPTSSWNVTQLAELEHTAGGLIQRSYPHSSTHLKLLFAKLTAFCIIIDDSIDDPAFCGEIVHFSHRLYAGENRDAAEPDAGALSDEPEGAVGCLRPHDYAVDIFIDACLIEKDMNVTQGARNNNCEPQIMCSSEEDSVDGSRSYYSWDRFALKFPYHWRFKSGIGEGYAAGIFKATEEQNLLLKKYIKALPDLIFFTSVMNDLMSFYKEERAGETCNFVHPIRSGVTGCKVTCESPPGSEERVSGIDWWHTSGNLSADYTTVEQAARIQR
ncbi:hypothetical protein DFH09DRAFT_1282659 [Mycena vulgaris]|nr:hypothetical protein DFH09DRAFT_1282659 [Mycena vulgaris]